MIFELQMPTGEVKAISVAKLSAIDGWTLQEKFVRFALSDDAKFRRAFTFEVFSHAKVLQADGGSLPLSTDALIQNHIGSWENVRDLFESILVHNGIDPKTHGQRSHYWTTAGEQMAASFMAAVFADPTVQRVIRNG
jgi:hypothetical protein